MLGKSVVAAAPRGQDLRVIDMRVLTTDDWKLWRTLRLAALAEAPYAFGSRLADWQGAGGREQRWQDRLAIPGSQNLLASLDARPVGMVSGVPTGEDGVVELISLWVEASARGVGVGDALIRAVERWARSNRATALRLAVRYGNGHAVALYRRHGFEVVAGADVVENGQREMVMVKPIDPR
ncbi:GNAT family N-acetyltransferase [Nocardia callitridis]